MGRAGSKLNPLGKNKIKFKVFKIRANFMKKTTGAKLFLFCDSDGLVAAEN